MPSKKQWINIAAIAALIVIPVYFVYTLTHAKWVQHKLPYIGEKEKDDAGREIEHTVGNIVLFDQNGGKVSIGQFDGSIIVASIFFATCPEVCPEMNGQIEALAREYRNMDNVKFLSVSIDPESDSIPVLKEYAKRFHADNYRWQMCTGDKEEIYDWVLHDLLLANQQDGRNFIHDDKVAIIDKERHIRAILPTRGETGKAKLDAYKRIKDDIENLLYEYREKELDK